MILAYLEYNEHGLEPASYAALEAAMKLSLFEPSSEVCAVLVGDKLPDVLSEQLLARISSTAPLRAGQELLKNEQNHILPAIDTHSRKAFEKCETDIRINRVWFVGHQALKHRLTLPRTLALQKAIEVLKPQTIVSAESSHTLEVFPRLAASLDCGLVTDVCDFVDRDTAIRPMCSGRVLARLKVNTLPRFYLVRPSAFSSKAGISYIESNSRISQTTPSEAEQRSAKCLATNIHLEPEEISALKELCLKESLLESHHASCSRPALTSARIVIGGGRAFGSSEAFRALLEPIADHLNAAIGASRAAIVSGFAPYDLQIGQTGKVIAPHVYLAVGISGSVHHLAGIRDSRIVVALNKDPLAPICCIADYVLIADLFETLPALENLLRKRLK